MIVDLLFAVVKLMGIAIIGKIHRMVVIYLHGVVQIAPRQLSTILDGIMMQEAATNAGSVILLLTLGVIAGLAKLLFL